MSISINDLKNILIPEEIINFNGLEIKITKHMSEIQRINISNQVANMIFDESIEIKEDFYSKDLKNIFFIASVVRLYTDIDCGDFTEYINICNIATSSGLYNTILDVVPSSEIAMLKEAFDYAIEYRKFEILKSHISANFSVLTSGIDLNVEDIKLKLDEVKADSLEMQLLNFTDKLVEKIPNEKGIVNLFKAVKKEINGFKPEKLKVIQDMVSAVGGKDIPTTENLNTALDGMKEFVSKNKK